MLCFSIPTGLITGIAAYATTRRLDPGAGVVGARTTATLVVLVVALWTLVIRARPLSAWKVGLVAAMVGIGGVVLAVPALASGLVLLPPLPGVLLLGAAIGVPAAVLVELVT